MFKQSDIEKISSQLKFISKLEPGQKISVNSQYIQNNTYYTSMVRYLTGESREKVYEYICDVIKDSFSVLDSLSDSSNTYDIEICKNIIGDLINLKPGLANLKTTYRKDKNYVSKMETLVQNLNVKIQELCDKKNIDLTILTLELEKLRLEEEKQEKQEQQGKQEKQEASTKPSKEEDTPNVLSGSSEGDEKKKTKSKTVKTYAEVAKSKNKSRRSRGQNTKKSHQYESYYMSNPDDIYNYPVDLDAGIIKKHN